MDPEIFGRYRIVGKLAGGGMGRVYRAVDTSMERPVALKLIDVMPDPESRDILEAERRGAALQDRLSAVEPRVVRIYEAGENDGYFFIAMEYVEGRDLSEVLSEGPLPPERAVSVAIELCEVLSNAHLFRAVLNGHEYQGIVHGDIKPRNIRITPGGQVKVLDFGIAKALSVTHSFTRNQFGSIPYSSPERLNRGEVNASSDVWSVGVVLYEMLEGRPYFEGDNPSLLEQQVRSYSELSASLLRVPVKLRQILGKALDPDPRHRYASADVLKRDLQAYLEGRPLSVESEAAPDQDATRRTAAARVNGTSDPDRTRRTSPGQGAPARPPNPPLAPEVLKRRQRNRRIAQVIFFAVIAFAFGNEMRVYKHANELKKDLDSERVRDPNSVWDQYMRLASQSYLPGVMSGAHDALRDRLVHQADQVIADYRESDAPTVTQKDWQRAESELGRALQLEPGDRNIKGKMRLCEGHLARIAGSGRNQGKWSEAKAKFEEAADLMPKSPDPHLGLARLYVYAFKDIDRAEKELREAEKHGDKMGKREKAQLADGYRDRGDEWVREAARTRGLPQEEEYLRRADEDYARAEDLYRSVAPFGSSAAMLRRIYDSRNSVASQIEVAKGERR
jgi:serine/threonine protein kinase